ncbi:MAG: helix-turn-helix transcriptional regulator [Clostridiales bacterium]|nr:helix-turn-helix transcriptional regulator [Clostridiales bacterium]
MTNQNPETELSKENLRIPGECDREGRRMGKRYVAGINMVFPGISVIYQESHVQRGKLEEIEISSDKVFEIFHCREGRMECRMADDLCYLSPGDLLLVKSSCRSSSIFFPLKHYHGIVIRIDTEKAPECLSCFLSDVAVQPKKIKEKFCDGKRYFIARSNPSVEHIFSELYNVPEKIRQGYSKIKVLELMLFLSVFDIEDRRSCDRSVSSNQAGLAKNIADYLTENMYEKITLKQAAEEFHVSETAVKNVFKAVYGVPFYAYIKTLKMESASYMLEYTDKTVLEIAGEHGYDNASKFAVAFRSVKGVSPGEYRLKHMKRR